MPAKISSNSDGSYSVTLTFQPGASMMESELNLQRALNEAGSIATGVCLEQFDTDGARIIVGGESLTTKGRLPKTYQTPYGEAVVARHVYQTSKGGETFCPMEIGARVVRTATPLFARQAAFKFAAMNSTAALEDMAQSGRIIARSYLQDLAGDTAAIAVEKESLWSYAPAPVQGEQVKSICIGVDGTCALFCNDGYRQVMVGTIALFDPNGERLHTTYVAHAPERGKAAFFEKMERETAAVFARFPHARVAAVADGAADHWQWLEERSQWQVVDFWHASEYLSAAVSAMARGQAAQERWLTEACHRLKHTTGAASALLAEMEQATTTPKIAAKDALQKAVSYFRNQLPRMNYALQTAMGLPIGSGVTEAACKCVVKERMCGSGMKWTSSGADHILALRTLTKTEGRWEQFWEKVSRFGFTQIKGPLPPSLTLCAS